MAKWDFNKQNTVLDDKNIHHLTSFQYFLGVDTFFHTPRLISMLDF